MFVKTLPQKETFASRHLTCTMLSCHCHYQIQNQIPGAIFPFVFYPIKPPKSVTLDSGLLVQFNMLYFL